MSNRYLAMWSGPRNISTAMMRSWGNRADAAVIDEPFYACYLSATGIEHPGAAEIMASQPTDWQQVVEDITGAIPDNKSLYYQKHITTHMLPAISRDWFGNMSHCFLIRSPDRVVASYSKTRPDTNADDLGYRIQHELFDDMKRLTGETPLVIDTDRFLQDPEDQLRQVCAALSIEFDPRMLSWEPGIRPSDGVWHPYWYAAVEKTTGFVSTVKPPPELSAEQQQIAAECRPHFDALAQYAIKSTT